MKKIAYILPGYGESHLRQAGYRKVAKMFEVAGIEPVHVDIDWNYAKPAKFSEFAKQFLKIYKKPKNTEVYILGFSYGATTAFITEAKTKPKALILCSLSPYFVEDQPKLLPKWLTFWRKSFVESDYSFNQLAKLITTETFLVVGGAEPSQCLARARDAKRKIYSSHLSVAKNALHKIGQKEYLTTLQKVINELE